MKNSIKNEEVMLMAEVVLPKIKEFNTSIDDIRQDVVSIASELEVINTQIDDVDTILVENEAKLIEKLQQSEDKLQVAIDATKESIINLEGSIISGKKDIANINSLLATVETNIKSLQSIEYTEYDDTEMRDLCDKMILDFENTYTSIKEDIAKVASTIPKENTLTAVEVADYFNKHEGILEASTIRGLIEAITNISNKHVENKISAPVLEILSNNRPILQGATRLNFIGGASNNNGTIDISTSGATTWVGYCTSPSTLFATLVSGSVRRHTLDGNYIYRLVPTPYTYANDSFYSSFDGTNLSGLLITRPH